jgi:hypothetical protein
LCAFTVQVYALPPVRPVTLIGVVVPVAEPVAPPLVDVQVAVYFGVVRGLPLACAAVNGVKCTDSTPGEVRDTVGCAIFAGAPTVTGTVGAELNP